MRAALLCLLLLLNTLPLFASNATAKKHRRLLRKSRVQKRKIWGKIWKNNAAIKKLTNTIDETQQIQQGFGSALATLKENVDDMKEDFVTMTMRMAQMKTSINDMKDTGQVAFQTFCIFYKTYVYFILYAIFQATFSNNHFW